MDEPLSALDRKTKNEILPFVEKLRDHFAVPIFYITHDLTEVERLADQVVLLDKGHVVPWRVRSASWRAIRTRRWRHLPGGCGGASRVR